ncbi:hypothetical protein KK141_01730 [Dyella sp. LX-66]|uniref:hypothetical protein n=1 Tax=unclassified Dyella TaxID=2634549 RepID=UPI001BE05B4B|nr:MULTISPECIES: hypothetical protein [unclassified Dyella]MBT2116240.1 hypothetical protein [Dyella sp. LX-1]MBT2138250.1 hypothetical protein [Dyella sp. LX-66]
MNEFEWHRQMRALREPVSPRRDLWADIEAKLDAGTPAAATTAPRARRGQRWLLAASFAGLSLLAVALNHQLRVETPATLEAQVPANWKPTDPRLAGAAVELDAARVELQQAMEQAPHSPALQRLLDRTAKRQSQLRQMEQQAG